MCGCLWDIGMRKAHGQDGTDGGCPLARLNRTVGRTTLHEAIERCARKH